jgi:predicted 3-demethylubiquinone-9 3-methyltransferase (glyoxalase superfamily)
MTRAQQIAPCLWFDTQAEEAAHYYVGIFKNARITDISRYGEAGKEIHGKPAGSVLTVEFELNGLPFMALNGGPVFKFNEAISLMVDCETQEEIDYYWEELGAGGPEDARQCGWLKDKYGVSWQVFPFALSRQMLGDPENPNSQRAFAAMMEMKKIDIAELKKAYEG